VETPQPGRAARDTHGRAAHATSDTAFVQYIVIERFRNGDAAPVYRRFRERGRLAPEGLTYVASWIDESMRVCYQVMESEDPALLDQWIANWTDLVEFEVIPVMTSAEAVAKIAPFL
jgi:hypothetical protein